MVRKSSIILVIALLAFTAACSSASSGKSAASGAKAVAAAAIACPTVSTGKFVKARFVSDIALAGGAFKRYIYAPAKAGKFQAGASGRAAALAKVATAGAFVVSRLDAAMTAAKAEPALCKQIAQPAQKFSAAVTGLIAKAKGGSISPSDVNSGETYLTDLHTAASHGGAAFTDNTSTNA